MFAEAILLKKWLRSDALWTKKWVYATPLKRIPLFWDTWTLLKSQYWPRERLERLTEERLKMLLKSASNVALWRRILSELKLDPRHFITSDIAKLPVTSKKSLMDLSEYDYTDARYADHCYIDYTSGSTGNPFRFFVDREFELRCFGVCERMFRVAGGGTRYPVISIRARERIGFGMINKVFFYLRGYNSVKHRLDDFIELASTFKKGFIVYGFPSTLVELGRQLRVRGISLPFRGVIPTGEELKPAAREEIEQTLKTRAYMCYSTRESGWLTFECEKGGLHVNEEAAYIEIVDVHGKHVPPGNEGKIIVTIFDNRVMPFIRYDTGDTGAFDTASCSCGRTLRTLRVSGRQSRYVRFKDGRVVSLLDISPAFDVFADAVKQYRIERSDDLTFRVLVIPGTLFDERKEELHARLVQVLHPNARIELVAMVELPESGSGKAVYFVETYHV